MRVGRETAGRTGKGVTVITGVPLKDHALFDFAKKIKQQCGAGGFVREDDSIEIQGEQRDRIIELLKPYGWLVKKVGG